MQNWWCLLATNCHCNSFTGTGVNGRVRASCWCVYSVPQMYGPIWRVCGRTVSKLERMGEDFVVALLQPCASGAQQAAYRT